MPRPGSRSNRSTRCRRALRGARPRRRRGSGVLALAALALGAGARVACDLDPLLPPRGRARRPPPTASAPRLALFTGPPHALGAALKRLRPHRREPAAPRARAAPARRLPGCAGRAGGGVLLGLLAEERSRLEPRSAPGASRFLAARSPRPGAESAWVALLRLRARSLRRAPEERGDAAGSTADPVAPVVEQLAERGIELRRGGQPVSGAQPLGRADVHVRRAHAGRVEHPLGRARASGRSRPSSSARILRRVPLATLYAPGGASPSSSARYASTMSSTCRKSRSESSALTLIRGGGAPLRSLRSGARSSPRRSDRAGPRRCGSMDAHATPPARELRKSAERSGAALVRA